MLLVISEPIDTTLTDSGGTDAWLIAAFVAVVVTVFAAASVRQLYRTVGDKISVGFGIVAIVAALLAGRLIADHVSSPRDRIWWCITFVVIALVGLWIAQRYPKVEVINQPSWSADFVGGVVGGVVVLIMVIVRIGIEVPYIVGSAILIGLVGLVVLVAWLFTS